MPAAGGGTRVIDEHLCDSVPQSRTFAIKTGGMCSRMVNVNRINWCKAHIAGSGEEEHVVGPNGEGRFIRGVTVIIANKHDAKNRALIGIELYGWELGVDQGQMQRLQRQRQRPAKVKDIHVQLGLRVGPGLDQEALLSTQCAGEGSYSAAVSAPLLCEHVVPKPPFETERSAPSVTLYHM